MKWTAQASACLVAVALVAGCNGSRDNRNAGTPGSETGSMSDTSHMSDTSAMRSDTGGMSRMPADTGAASTDTSRMRSPGATKTRPDQGQPVTSKGDTVNPSVDSAQ